MSAGRAQESRGGDAKDRVQRFFAGLTDDDEANAKLATALVGSGEKVEAHLADGLMSRPARQIIWGMKCLAELKYSEAEELFKRIATSGPKEARSAALQALIACGAAGSADFVVPLAADDDPMVRRRAFDALAALPAGNDAVAGAAVRGLSDEDFWVRMRALAILAAAPKAKERAPDPLSAAIAGTLESVQPDAAAQVIDILVRRMGQNVRPVLEKALLSREAQLAAAAVGAIGRLRLAESAEAVAALLERDEPTVVKEALKCLVALKATAALPAIVTVLEKTPDASVRDGAASALRQLTGKTYGFDVARWRSHLAG